MIEGMSLMANPSIWHWGLKINLQLDDMEVTADYSGNNLGERKQTNNYSQYF